MAQSTIRNDQATGVVGEIALSGPVRAQAGIFVKETGVPGIIGRAMTHSDDDAFTMGGNGPFAGILASPKQYVKNGIGATMEVPEFTVVEAVYFTTGMFVELENAANVGDGVEFSETDGKLRGNSTGTASSGYHLIPNARVVRKSIAAPGLAIIELTE